MCVCVCVCVCVCLYVGLWMCILVFMLLPMIISWRPLSLKRERWRNYKECYKDRETEREREIERETDRQKERETERDRERERIPYQNLMHYESLTYFWYVKLNKTVLKIFDKKIKNLNIYVNENASFCFFSWYYQINSTY